MVLKLTNYKWRKLKLTAALTSRSEKVSLNYDARIRLQTKNFKQTFHQHLNSLQYNTMQYNTIRIQYNNVLMSITSEKGCPYSRAKGSC